MRLPLTLAASLGILGCGGSTDPSRIDELLMRFRANGALVEYTEPTGLFAAASTTSGQSSLIITGIDPTTQSNTGLQVWGAGEIGTGTHSGYDIVNSILVGTLMHYEDAAGVTYSSDPQTPGHTVLTISEITATRVRGTFTGIVAAQGLAGVTVTEGQFLVQRTP